jgi:hypothetical protein
LTRKRGVTIFLIGKNARDSILVITIRTEENEMKKMMLTAMVMAVVFVFMISLSFARGVEKKSESTSMFHSVKDMIGWEVKNAEGGTLGTVDDYIHDEKGRLAFAILSQGGILGMGEKKIAVPFDTLSIADEMDHFVLNISEDRLASAPEFDEAEGLDRQYAERVYRHFGLQPYWMEEGAAGETGIGGEFEFESEPGETQPSDQY